MFYFVFLTEKKKKKKRESRKGNKNIRSYVAAAPTAEALGGDNKYQIRRGLELCIILIDNK